MISLLMKPLLFVAAKMAISSTVCSSWWVFEEPKMPEKLKMAKKTEK